MHNDLWGEKSFAETLFKGNKGKTHLYPFTISLFCIEKGLGIHPGMSYECVLNLKLNKNKKRKRLRKLKPLRSQNVIQGPQIRSRCRTHYAVTLILVFIFFYPMSEITDISSKWC